MTLRYIHIWLALVPEGDLCKIVKWVRRLAPVFPPCAKIRVIGRQDAGVLILAV